MKLGLQKNKNAEPPEQEQSLAQFLAPPPQVILKKQPANPLPNVIYLLEDQLTPAILAAVQQSQTLFEKGELIDGFEALRKAKQLLKASKSQGGGKQAVVTSLNLGTCYYKIGVLEQSLAQFSIVQNILKTRFIKKLPFPSSLATIPRDFLDNYYQRILTKEMRGRIQLQNCILFSEVGKHDLALKHARAGCKLFYNIIWDHLILCYLLLLKLYNDRRDKQRVNYILTAERHSKRNQLQPEIDRSTDHPVDDTTRILKIIALLQHFTCHDFKNELLNPAKQQFALRLSHQLSYMSGDKQPVDLQILFLQLKQNHWLLKKKILNQIQMETITVKSLVQPEPKVDGLRILQNFDYLAVSFYCISTQVRFTEKPEKKKGGLLLQSQQWLGRSLQVAFLYLPHDAPILTQIHSVYLKFHGIGKQIIPEDKDLDGVVKILKPLKGAGSRTSSISAPILIRVPRKRAYDQQQQEKGNDNKSRQSKRSEVVTLQKIYKNSVSLPKKNAWFEKGSRERRAQSLSRQSETIDVMEVNSRVQSKKVDIMINNNINLFINQQMRGFDDQPKNITIQLSKRKSNSQRGVFSDIQQQPDKKINGSALSMKINMNSRRHPYSRRQFLVRKREVPASKETLI